MCFGIKKITYILCIEEQGAKNELKLYLIKKRLKYVKNKADHQIKELFGHYCFRTL